MVSLVFVLVWCLTQLFDFGVLLNGLMLLCMTMIFSCFSMEGLVYSINYVCLSHFSALILMLVMLIGLVVKGVMMCSSQELNLYFLMEVMLILFFLVDSWLYIYVIYEGVMLPLILGIMIYGGYFERVGSCVYLLLYMTIFTLPLLFFIVNMFIKSQDMKVLYSSLYWYDWMLWSMIITMMVKVPLYGLHGWLPKVHVEAPTWGSIMLAGVMIKMGLYGAWLLLYYSGYNLVFLYIALWGILGGIFSGLGCVMSSDIKMVIAYSSIVHMASCVWLLFMNPSYSWRGLFMIILCHGLISSGLFLWAGMMSVDLKSRSLMVMGGIVLMFSMTGFMLVFSLIWNLGFPLSGSFIGELELFYSLIGVSYLLGFMVFSYMVISCIYNLILIIVVCSGVMVNYYSMGGGLMLGCFYWIMVSSGVLFMSSSIL